MHEAVATDQSIGRMKLFVRRRFLQQWPSTPDNPPDSTARRREVRQRQAQAQGAP
jgi:hypothetical protein